MSTPQLRETRASARLAAREHATALLLESARAEWVAEYARLGALEAGEGDPVLRWGGGGEDLPIFSFLSLCGCLCETSDSERKRPPRASIFLIDLFVLLPLHGRAEARRKREAWEARRPPGPAPDPAASPPPSPSPSPASSSPSPSPMHTSPPPAPATPPRLPNATAATMSPPPTAPGPAPPTATLHPQATTTAATFTASDSDSTNNRPPYSAAGPSVPWPVIADQVLTRSILTQFRVVSRCTVSLLRGHLRLQERWAALWDLQLHLAPGYAAVCVAAVRSALRSQGEPSIERCGWARALT